MELNYKTLRENKELLQKKGYKIPSYDIYKNRERTKENCKWLHIGSGNIFRAFIVKLCDQLLDEGLFDSGIISLGLRRFELFREVFEKTDYLTSSFSLNSDGTIEKRILASAVKGYPCDFSSERVFEKLKRLWTNKDLELVSFTITEKGYNVLDGEGNFLKAVKEDVERETLKAKSSMGIVASLLYERFKEGGYPLALLSLDNCSNNGDKLKDSILRIALAWKEKGFVEKGFIDYINDEKLVSFPISMIDKITPQSQEFVRDILKEDGFENLDFIKLRDGSESSNFVNAEECEYLVVEDNFPNKRPPLEKVGVIFCSREDVEKAERMKVSCCLNPLHTALAISGMLLDYETIADEMEDADLNAFVKRIAQEGLRVCQDPGVLSLNQFLFDVLNKRLVNKFLKDSPKRIATDTSQKISVRFGTTIKNYLAKHISLTELNFIPLVFALYLRYLMALDDNLESFCCSSDPLLAELQGLMKDIKIGSEGISSIDKILSREEIFSLDLTKTELYDKIKAYFKELIRGKGSVRQTIRKALENGC